MKLKKALLAILVLTLSVSAVAEVKLPAVLNENMVLQQQMKVPIWGFADPERIETRTVDMHIAKLRKKLDAIGDALIETVRGEGYRFAP